MKTRGQICELGVWINDCYIGDEEWYSEEEWNIRKQEVKEVIEEVCHSLGEPDFNGENHIKNIDGMHWKELAEKFETKLNIK